MEFLVLDEAELNGVAEYILSHLATKNIILFSGNLGAGKTTLIKQIGKKMGVISAMSSPSFGIVNQYKTKTSRLLNHIDLYRIVHVAELYDFGLPEMLDSGQLNLIEWPEMAEEIWHQYDYMQVEISIEKGNKRRIFVSC
ncbi:MAG: tRNA (adenosine(37)-N6)-threonylcarbamoyltransferase complex ATPase subunit type 1 TsaE [Flavobacteriales bacterium]|nr:tRNA (adenosine(37)-N6)-threonylcarbamoyltransferase complex ATPase subunit type 1 TsaE [Flavobacteriales bacterium]